MRSQRIKRSRLVVQKSVWLGKMCLLMIMSLTCAAASLRDVAAKILTKAASNQNYIQQLCCCRCLCSKYFFLCPPPPTKWVPVLNQSQCLFSTSAFCSHHRMLWLWHWKKSGANAAPTLGWTRRCCQLLSTESSFWFSQKLLGIWLKSQIKFLQSKYFPLSVFGTG